MDMIIDNTAFGVHPVTISEVEKEDIIRVSKDPDLLTKIACSIAPAVTVSVGLKMRLALQLFGGSNWTLDDGTVMRGNIHNLIISGSDASMSDILSAMGRIAPVSILLPEHPCIRTISEYGTSEPLLCIEDLSVYGPVERCGIHDAMVGGRISVLAAVTPNNGRITDNVPFLEQIGISIPILSQFDSISVITNMPDDEDKGPFYSEDFMRRYISYARTSCDPHVDVKSFTSIEDAYISLKGYGATTMQLESLFRLSEASARSRLSDNVNETDIEMAKIIVAGYLRDMQPYYEKS